MSASQILQQLYSLDPSSPEIPHLLDDLIRRDEEEQYLSNLRGSELTRVVDCLDQVRPLLSASRVVIKQTLQALTAIPATDDVSRRCLPKLQAICGDNMTLPSSYTISGDDLARAGDHPIAFGGFADVWEGTYGAKKVCVKVLKISTHDDQALSKVRIRHVAFFSYLLSNTRWHRSHSSVRP